MTSTNSQVFLSNLEDLYGAYIGNTQKGSLIYTYMQQLANTYVNNLNTKLGNPSLFNSSTVNNYTSFVNFLTNSSSTSDPTNSSDPMNGFYNAFLLLGGYSGAAGDDTGSLVNPSNLPQQFEALFTNFLQNLNTSIFTSSSGTSTVTVNGISYTVTAQNNYSNFFKAFLSYLSTTSVVQSSSTATVLSYLTNTATGSNTFMQSYQQIYEAFNGPIGTLSSNPNDWTPAQQLFVERFTQFYNSELAKTATSSQPSGFFDASQDLSDWYKYSQNLYYNPQYNPNAVIADPDSTIIINNVMLLLIQMIGTTQSVAAAQAENLNFLSQWQAAYSSKLNNIHIFAQGDNSVISTTGPNNASDWTDNFAKAAVRTQLDNVNQNYITKLQGNQQTISDTAKSLQSNVNQSSDAATQQASFVSSLLQTLATMLSTMYR